jgi:hypothetical protein
VEAARPSGSDPGQIRELLATAQGYVVFGREGKRIGSLIELVGPAGERIAIRHDGVVLWRRRLLPITFVANVLPERRAVLLNVDRRTLSRTVAAPDALGSPPYSAAEGADCSGDWHERVARSVAAGENEADQTKGDRGDPASEPSAGSPGPERPTRAAPRATPEPGQRDRSNTAHHLLFVSTPAGYLLVEQVGPPPPLGPDFEVPEQPGSFRVVKLGPSPLPNDPRICAYLEGTE